MAIGWHHEPTSIKKQSIILHVDSSVLKYNQLDSTYTGHGKLGISDIRMLTDLEIALAIKSKRTGKTVAFNTRECSIYMDRSGMNDGFTRIHVHADVTLAIMGQSAGLLRNPERPFENLMHQKITALVQFDIVQTFHSDMQACIYWMGDHVPSELRRQDFSNMF